MPVNILDPWMLVLSAGIYKRAFPRERLCKSWAEELLGFSFCIFFSRQFRFCEKFGLLRYTEFYNYWTCWSYLIFFLYGFLAFYYTCMHTCNFTWMFVGNNFEVLAAKKKRSASSLYCRSSLTDSPVPEKTKMDFLSCSAFSILRKFVSWEPCFNGVLGVLG